ncbi:MAG: spore coat associated protein CotJA [Peptococcaceae bacterium]|jgi:hypothetical protein|nr:MAG: spore coat associated protein CotJA [Peptococcaceae bacterium]
MKRHFFGPFPPNHSHPPADYPQKPEPLPHPPMPGHHKLAEACVPWQKYGQTFSPGEALVKGTIFPELYRPYNIN